MLDDKTIQIDGKELKYGRLTDDSLIKLYRKLKQREFVAFKKMLKYEKLLRKAKTENN